MRHSNVMRLGDWMIILFVSVPGAVALVWGGFHLVGWLTEHYVLQFYFGAFAGVAVALGWLCICLLAALLAKILG